MNKLTLALILLAPLALASCGIALPAPLASQPAPLGSEENPVVLQEGVTATEAPGSEALTAQVNVVCDKRVVVDPTRTYVLRQGVLASIWDKNPNLSTPTTQTFTVNGTITASLSGSLGITVVEKVISSTFGVSVGASVGVSQSKTISIPAQRQARIRVDAKGYQYLAREEIKRFANPSFPIPFVCASNWERNGVTSTYWQPDRNSVSLTQEYKPL